MKICLENIFSDIRPETADGLFEGIEDIGISNGIKNRIAGKINVPYKSKSSTRFRRITLYAAVAALIAVIAVTIPLLIKSKTPNDNILYPIRTTDQEGEVSAVSTTTTSTGSTSSADITIITRSSIAGDISETVTTNIVTSPSGTDFTQSNTDLSATNKPSLTVSSNTVPSLSQTVIQPTSYPTQADTQPTSYPTQTNAQPTSYPTQHITQPTSYPTQHITQPTSYPTQSETHRATDPSDSSSTPQTTLESITFPTNYIQADPPASAFVGEDIDSIGNEAASLVDDGMCAVVKASYTSKDTYKIYGDHTQNEYFLVQFRINELIIGNYSGNSFYSIIPKQYFTDFKSYEKILVYNLHQIAFDRYVLYNESTGEAEQLTLPLFGEYFEDKNEIIFRGWKYIPYRYGKPDLSLWETNDAWNNNTKYYRQYVSEEFGTLNDAIKEIKKNLAWDEDEFTVLTFDNYTGKDAKKVLDYVSYLRNGIFVQPLYYNLLGADSVSIRFTRYIKGYPTDEIYKCYIYIKKHPGSTEEYGIFASNVYSKEDIGRLPDLSVHFDTVLQQLKKGEISPPHLDENAEADSMKYGLIALYAKSGDNVYGVLRAGFLTEIHGQGHYIDEKYYIVYENGEISEISRDALLELIPGCPNVYRGEYVKNGRPVEIIG